jgi:hypothetical protein
MVRVAPQFKRQTGKIFREKREVIDGPFGRPESLIAGYWIWKVNSMTRLFHG